MQSANGSGRNTEPQKTWDHTVLCSHNLETTNLTTTQHTMKLRHMTQRHATAQNCSLAMWLLCTAPLARPRRQAQARVKGETGRQVLPAMLQGHDVLPAPAAAARGDDDLLSENGQLLAVIIHELVNLLGGVGVLNLLLGFLSPAAEVAEEGLLEGPLLCFPDEVSVQSFRMLSLRPQPLLLAWRFAQAKLGMLVVAMVALLTEAAPRFAPHEAAWLTLAPEVATRPPRGWWTQLLLLNSMLLVLVQDLFLLGLLALA